MFSSKLKVNCLLLHLANQPSDIDYGLDFDFDTKYSTLTLTLNFELYHDPDLTFTSKTTDIDQFQSTPYHYFGLDLWPMTLNFIHSLAKVYILSHASKTGSPKNRLGSGL